MKKTTRYLFLSFILVNSTPSFSQWVTNPAINTPVAVVMGTDQIDTRLVTDGKGGAILVWEDQRTDGSTSDIYAQRLDAAGFPKWSANGIAICTISGTSQSFASIESDGNGGAIITWQDWRNGNRDIYAQRVDSSGNVKWTANGVAVCNKAYHQQNPKLITDGSGGAIIVWQDSSGASWDIFAQRVDASGVVSWTTGGVAICSNMDQQVNPKIESDGAGGAIMVWQDKRTGNDYDIYAQRINGAGLVQWTSGGVAVCSIIDTQNNPKIESDGNSGAIIAWADARDGIDYDIYAQRINGSGAPQWAANGVVITKAVDNQSAVDIATDGMTNGAVMVWKDSRMGTNSDIYAQRIDMNGTVKWSLNGIPVAVSSFSQVNPNIIGDDSGGVIIAWQDSSVSGGYDIYSQRIDSSGNKLWASAGVPTGTAAGEQSGPKQVSDGKGGAVFAWQDERSGTSFDIYAHHLFDNGTPIGISDMDFIRSSIRMVPNPSSGPVRVILPDALLNENITIILMDISGREVLNRTADYASEVELIVSDIPSGIYFIRINQIYFDKLEIIR